MTTTSTAAATTATMKRQVRETLKAAGITARVASSATLVNVTLADAGDAQTALRVLPGSYVASYSPRLVLVPR